MRQTYSDCARALVWFRRDLRLEDHAALYHALRAARQVYCAFVFDTEILDALPSRADRRVEFIWESVRALKDALRDAGGDLVVLHGRAREEVPRLARALAVAAVFAGDDYEPRAIARDRAVREALERLGVAFHAVKDTVVFEKDELLTQAGGRFTVFTPYRNAWLRKLDDACLRPYPVERYFGHLARPWQERPLPVLEEIGFGRTGLRALGIRAGTAGAVALLDDFLERIDGYREARDFPAVHGVSYLSVHNRFGTVSVRRLARLARERGGAGAETWLSELIWRDFFFQVLYHHPHAATSALRPTCAAIRWPNDEKLFSAWREARTGYPIIDAAMRQLHRTGYMHNRLRMIAASFLVKDLLVDWRWGERHFAEHLNDFDLAANNGGWQWAASTGCDAQPYFRIFNPVSQSRRYDPDGTFIRRYLPELAGVPTQLIHAPWTMRPVDQEAIGCVIGRDYPAPVVDHAAQRTKALALFAPAKGR